MEERKKKPNTLREDNAHLTDRVSLITGTRWCQSCSRYASAPGGTMREIRSRHGFTKRWICSTCLAKKTPAGFGRKPDGK